MVICAGHTDIGRRRPLNEDSIYAEDGVFLVCDGMGGHKAGEVASRLAVEAIAGFLRRSAEDPEMTWPYGYDPELPHDANRLSTAIKLANRVVYRKSMSEDDYTGMGTTVVAAMVAPRRPLMTYAHVGDSRIYRIQAGAMRQLTRDDTWANLQSPEAAEDEAATSMRNVLTKALGAREDVEFALNELTLADGDIILLCSDGLTNMLPDARILEIVTSCEGDLDAACRQLTLRANEEGGRDNISVVLVRYSA
jgi:serine/threonine protein phosphatase PrpC